MTNKMIKKWGLTFLGMILGAVAGYFYWREIGCASGTCMITSKPLNSSIYGAVMGGLLSNIIKDFSFQKK